MDRTSAFYALLGRELIGIAEPWKPILRDMIRALIAKFPDAEQQRLIPRDEITKVITLRRMIQLPLEVREEARTWDGWCNVLWQGLPRATYSLWNDILQYLFKSPLIGDVALAEYLELYNMRTAAYTDKHLDIIRWAPCEEYHYDDLRIEAEYEHKHIYSDVIRTQDDATKFLEKHWCKLDDPAHQQQLFAVIQEAATAVMPMRVHLDIAPVFIYAHVYTILPAGVTQTLQ